jgi:tetratricopeptide (TPR) repeat protein
MTKALFLHVMFILSLWPMLGGNRATAQTLADDPAFVASRQATEAFNRQDYPKAESLARQAIAHYPQHFIAHYLLGQSALATSQWEDAAQAFSTVLQLYPKCFVGHRDLGIALTQANRADEAGSAYQAALALRPESEDVQVRLAFLYVQAGRQEAALSLLKSLTDKGTTLPEVWATFGRLLYDTKEFTASEKALRRAAELRDDGNIWFNLGAVRLYLQDVPGARAAFEQAARQCVDPAPAHDDSEEVPNLCIRKPCTTS